MPNAIDSRTPMILAHAKLTYFCGICIVSHNDWQVVDSPIFENNQTDEVRTWVLANGYYIEKFFGLGSGRVFDPSIVAAENC